MKLLLTVSLQFALLISYSQSRDKEIIGNQTIISLYKAGISQDIIIQKIRSSACSFNLVTDSLISLKKMSIPDEIINTMMNPGDPEKHVEAQGLAEKANEPVQSGIYFARETPAI